MSKPILIYRDQKQIDDVLEWFNRFDHTYSKICKDFADLQIGTIQNKPEFSRAMTEPELFVKEKSAEIVKANHTFEVGGIKLKSSVLVDMLDFKELNEFVLAAQEADQNAQKAWQEVGHQCCPKR